MSNSSHLQATRLIERLEVKIDRGSEATINSRSIEVITQCTAAIESALALCDDVSRKVPEPPQYAPTREQLLQALRLGKDMSQEAICLLSQAEAMQGYDLSSAELTGVDLGGLFIIGANLKNTNLRGANLAGAIFFDCNFEGADFSEANLTGAVLNACVLHDALFAGTDMRGCWFASKAHRANFQYANLELAVFAGAYLTNADLQYANLRECWLCWVNLSGVDFQFADLLHMQTWGNTEDLNLRLPDGRKYDPLRTKRFLRFYTDPTRLYWDPKTKSYAKLKKPPLAPS
jgi:uncharacterized protein YjbI with pentapeptide repeats